MKWLTLSILFVLTLNPELPIIQESLEEWKFKKEVEGIHIYTRDIVGTNLKELKIEMVFENTNLATIMAVLRDSEAYTEWLYKCMASKTIEQKSTFETRDYYKLDFPWPLNDRDLYTKSVVRQDPNTHEVEIETTAVPDYGEEKEGFVRVKEHFNIWKFIPLEESKIRLIYTARSKPGGNIPDWMVNMVIDRGPVLSMKNLRKMILKEKYTSRPLKWITN